MIKYIRVILVFALRKQKEQTDFRLNGSVRIHPGFLQWKQFYCEGCCLPVCLILCVDLYKHRPHTAFGGFVSRVSTLKYFEALCREELLFLFRPNSPLNISLHLHLHLLVCLHVTHFFLNPLTVSCRRVPLPPCSYVFPGNRGPLCSSQHRRQKCRCRSTSKLAPAAR